MNPISIAASAIAVVQISIEIISLCSQYSQYSRDFKDAKDDIERLQRKVGDYSHTLEQIYQFLNNQDGTRLPTTPDLINLLKQYLEKLKTLQADLDPKKTHKAMSRFGFRALKWPFTSKQVDKIVTDLEQYERTFSIMLQVEQKLNLAQAPVDQGAYYDSHTKEHNAQYLMPARDALLSDITNWARDDRKYMFWLSGMAGTNVLIAVLEFGDPLIAKDGIEGNNAMSFRDSAYETMSEIGSVQAAINLPGVRDEAVDILVTDGSLRQSGQDAIGVLSAEDFVVLFRDLLRLFSDELKREALQTEQRDAAYVFRYHASFAARIACECWRGKEEPGWAKMLAQLPEKKIELEHAVQHVTSRTGPESGAGDNDSIDDEWEDSNLVDMHQLVHLKRLENFITNSNAFRNLQRNLQDAVIKRNTNEARMLNSPRFCFTKSPTTAINDLCKRTVERLAGTRLSWWPLTEPEEELRANYTRVYSQPLAGLQHRNRRFYDDVPTSLAEELFHGLVAARNLASGAGWEALRHEAVFLEGTTLMRILCNRNSEPAILCISTVDRLIIEQDKELFPMTMDRVQGTIRMQRVSKATELYNVVKLKKSETFNNSERATPPSSTAKGKQPIVGNDRHDIEMMPMGGGPARTEPPTNEGGGNQQENTPPNEGDGNQPDDTGRNEGDENQQENTQGNEGGGNQQDNAPPNAGGGNQQDNTPREIFLSIDLFANDSRARSVDVGDADTDKQIMTKLRQSYNTLRSPFLWNRKRAVGVKFYRVSQISNNCLLTPCSQTPQFRSFLYRRPEKCHYVELHRDKERYPDGTGGDYQCELKNGCEEDKIYPNGEVWYFFNHPNDCGTFSHLKKLLPKRKSETPRSGITVYGLYIEQRHSVWQIFIPIVIVLALTLGSTLWFIRPWLRTHPDDLQGATVPVFLAFTVVQFVLTLLTTLVVFRWSL